MLHFLQKLFSSKATHAQWHAVALTPQQARSHARWVQQRVFLNWLGPYFKAYHLLKGGAGGQRGLRVELLQENGRQGVLLHYDASIGPGNFRHFFEHLAERVLALGYHRACTDQRTQQQQRHTETLLKQLLKPTPTDCPQTGHCNQRYGLITLDYVMMDRQPLFIRLASNAVLQPGFTRACSFDELMRALFDAPMPDEQVQRLVADYHDRF
ncbi:hypothetical protein GCM10023185_24280 [Hymenobacter saemangeumensis]|uniref:Uncharacterized protein n=1 Tax=Hymenobacter saemangeumensis TaxID=1084522 RepID=A0ABP8IGN6_9BACT